MRIVLFVNDHESKEQTGYKRPFQDLKNAGLISEFVSLSPGLRLDQGASRADVEKETLDAFISLKPDVVFVMHPHNMAFTSELVAKMRFICLFKLILWEGDGFSLLRKQPSKSDLVVARNADVIYTVGKGSFRKNFLLYGARDVRWVPHCFEPDRIPSIDKVNLSVGNFKHDVVAILNKSLHTIRPAQSWKERRNFVELCQKSFGDRLAIYGAGWDGTGVKGAISFDDQYVAVSEARVTANWDHYATQPWYFSDRLPISLAAGSVHATTFHPGYDQIFGPSTSEFLLLESSPRQLINRIEEFLLHTSDERIMELRMRARTFAYKNFRQDDWIVRMLNFDKVNVPLEAARKSWSK